LLSESLLFPIAVIDVNWLSSIDCRGLLLACLIFDIAVIGTDFCFSLIDVRGILDKQMM
jgi:hypothetical protein